jgi:hypothetical protein
MANDIILHEGYEPVIADDDFTVGESAAQHEKLLLVSHQGEWRQHPACGVGIQRYINDEAPGDLVSAIRTELRNDGMKVRTVRITADEKIVIDAEYE